MRQSFDNGQNSEGVISDFQISGQSFITENCLNSRTSYYIDIKLGLVTKLNKRNTATSKTIDDDVWSTNCDVIAFFPIYRQSEAIQKPGSGLMDYKTYKFFINSNPKSYKTWKQNYKISDNALILLLWVKLLFLPKNADISKINEVLVLNRIIQDMLRMYLQLYCSHKKIYVLLVFTWYIQWFLNQKTTPLKLAVF